MNFDKEDDHILLLLVASGVAILLTILPKLKRQLVWVKSWLQRNIKFLSQHYIRNKPTTPP